MQPLLELEVIINRLSEIMARSLFLNLLCVQKITRPLDQFAKQRKIIHLYGRKRVLSERKSWKHWYETTAEA